MQEEYTEGEIDTLTDLSIDKAEKARDYIKSLFLASFPDDKSEKIRQLHLSGITGICVIILADALASAPANEQKALLDQLTCELYDYVSYNMTFADFRRNNEKYKEEERRARQADETSATS